jgi:hypothetical protein
MFSSLLTLAALGSALVSAAPMEPVNVVWQAPSFGDKFGMAATSINGSTAIINKDLTASEGRIYIGGTQTPNCTDSTGYNARQDFATFVWYSDKTVFLYKQEYPPQQLWVDASGMGMGITGYTSGDQQPPKNAGRGPFEIDSATRDVTFNGVGAKACPTTEEGKWSLWFTENATPGYQEGCVSVELKAYKADARVACTYSWGS